MSRPPAAREAVLDAFERILIDDGERAATLDATARAAGVSKGGLLYHFASKDALVEGLLERLRALIDEDVADIENAPEGAVAYFLRTSTAVDTPLDRACIAATRLAQGGHHAAGDVLRQMRQRWLDVMNAHVDDPTVALVVSLVSDGLYYDAALRSTGDVGTLPVGPRELDEVIALLERLSTRR